MNSTFPNKKNFAQKLRFINENQTKLLVWFEENGKLAGNETT